jgi:hypothetical protein
MKPNTLRDFTCECADPKCRERIYLSIGTYRKMAREGRVVSPGHESCPPSLIVRLTRDAAVVI